MKNLLKYNINNKEIKLGDMSNRNTEESKIDAKNK